MSHSFKHINLTNYIIIIFVFLLPISLNYHMSLEEIQQNVLQHYITYGSSLRMQNIITKYYLSSFNLNWSTGSRLQIITGIKEDYEQESLFIIKEGETYPVKENGEHVKCGDIIRLEHVQTGKNIHSHEFPSFVTGAQEACGFGENGNGDVNDNFEIICYKWNEKDIKGETQFFLQHVPTKKYLFMDYKKSLFNDYNCRGCPIRGQREVSLTGNKDKQCLWQVVGGILFSDPDKENKDEKKEEKNINEDL